MCPFQNNDQEDGFSCNHPTSDIDSSEMTPYEKRNEYCIPDKCPLRTEAILIEINKS